MKYVGAVFALFGVFLGMLGLWGAVQFARGAETLHTFWDFAVLGPLLAACVLLCLVVGVALMRGCFIAGANLANGLNIDGSELTPPPSQPPTDGPSDATARTRTTWEPDYQKRKQ